MKCEKCGQEAKPLMRIGKKIVLSCGHNVEAKE